ncbi:MAG: entericidin A/B family lipoprotein [Burkholderiales bacterium]|jgi:predicted small secreted protein|nr:MAG: entericidin A/B family lipoprotein [Burkholderiales bacterium]
MKRILIALLAGAFGLSLAACNTMAGAGKDIEKAGETIQGAAKK